MTAPNSCVELRAGRLYFPRATYEMFFGGRSSVILFRRDGDLLIMPVSDAAAGGFVVKIRNAAGDRLIEAIDFFRAHDRCEAEPQTLDTIWEPGAAALVAYNLFELQT